MMEEQSKTFAGKMSNLADTFNQKLTTMGNSMLPLLKPMIDWAIDAISKINVDQIIVKYGSSYYNQKVTKTNSKNIKNNNALAACLSK